MQESFLHFIWRNQYFDKRELITTNGQHIVIFEPGIPNHDAGPDFGQARISLAEMQWMGEVEIHIKSSHWFQHFHQNDPAYEQVILHVVWKDDQPVIRKDGSYLPTLELQGRVALKVLLKLRNLTESSQRLSCHGLYHASHLPLLNGMLERSLAQSLIRKERRIIRLWQHCNGDWDTTTYRLLGRNFGFKINNEAFEDLVKAVPLNVAKRLSSRVLQLEALYFGQAGMLGQPTHDRYMGLLQREYKYLLKMFPGLPKPLDVHRWKYLRLRPANFPATRIAQFVQLMHRHQYRFSIYRELGRWQQLQPLLMHQCSDYWTHHFQFEKVTTERSTRLGQNSICNIAINTVVPLLVTYYGHLGRKDQQQSVLDFLRFMPAEQNSITRYWKKNGFKVTSAYHSQGLLALNKNYCKLKHCLHCAIGISLIKGQTA